MTDPLCFRDYLAEAAKIGTVTGRPHPDQVVELDRAIRRLAATDPMMTRSRVLTAYARGDPLPTD